MLLYVSSGAVLPLLFQGSLEVAVVNLDSHLDKSLQVVRRVRPCNLILYSVLQSNIVLSLESLVVPAGLICVLLKNCRVTGSRSSLLQVLNVPFRCSSLIDIAEDSINPILESLELHEYLLGFLGYRSRNLALRGAVLNIVVKECFDLVKGRSPKERGYPQNFVGLGRELVSIKPGIELDLRKVCSKLSAISIVEIRLGNLRNSLDVER